MTETAYRELPPPPSLARHVACFWVRSTGNRPVSPSHVVPDGCIDIVWIGDAPATVVGPNLWPFIAALPPQTTVVGVRFRPGMAPPVLATPANELLDLKVPLEDLWGHEARCLTERLAHGSTLATKLAAVEVAIIARLAVAPPADLLVTAAVTHLAHDPGASIGALAIALGVSERQLRRRCVATIGYGPKMLGCILRFQRVWHAAAAVAAGRVPLAHLAADLGYTDQAHLTREFSRFAGTPPATLFAQHAGNVALSD